MQIEFRNIEDLLPYKRNSKSHELKQVSQVAASIKEFGFNVPILVDEKSRIIAGHGRVLAAKQLGMKEVPIIALHHLTDAKRRAFIIVDNKLTENADWDNEMLALEFKELGLLDLDFSLEITGFDAREIDLVMLAEESPVHEEHSIIESLRGAFVVRRYLGIKAAPAGLRRFHKRANIRTIAPRKPR